MTEESAPTQISNPWDRQPGEPAVWYSRFENYRLLGPERSMLQGYNAWRARKGRTKSARVPGNWDKMASLWYWVKRADAWDDQERGRLRARRDVEVDRLFQHIEMATRTFYSKVSQRLETLEAKELPSAALIPQFLSIVKKLEEIYDRVPTTERVDVNIVSPEERAALRERILKQVAQVPDPLPGSHENSTD